MKNGDLSLLLYGYNGVGSRMTYLPFARPTIDEQTIAGVVGVLRSGWLATGPYVRELEQALSAYLGGRSVRCFTSATEALEIALRSCGIGAGDEVIVPALSFAATGNVVLRVGAVPKFVDVERASRNIDVAAVEAAITPRTKAILPVHFAGLAADVDALYQVARQRGLRVIEDAAHAIGSECGERKIGSFGDIVCFSFHPNKNMTTIEGGALVTDDLEVLEKATLHRFHGIERREGNEIDVLLAGGKSNLSDVAARIGLGQLQRIDEFNARRRLLVGRYFELLSDEDVVELPMQGTGHSWHMFAPLLSSGSVHISRREFIERMHERGIGVGIHYPAMHLFSVYRELGYRAGDFPNAEHIGSTCVTLPLFPAMEEHDVDRVVTGLRAVLSVAVND